jgi:hypothetical protein
MTYALCAFKKNKKKQEKTMMVLFGFICFILFFIRPLAELYTKLDF